MTLTYSASANTVTGFYDSTAIGSYSLASWGANPTLTLAVAGYSSGALMGVPAGTDTASNLLVISTPLQVATVYLPSVTNGMAYSDKLSAIGGRTPYNWSLIAGSLPPGLALATNGLISGTSTNNGSFGFTVQVTDASFETATQPMTLMVGSTPRIVLQPTNNQIGVVAGNSVSLTVSVAGTGPFSYQWQLNGTNLPNGIITTVAGGGTNGLGDGGAATNAQLSGPSGVAFDATGDLFIADSYNNRIRKVGTNGVVTTVAGNGIGGYFGDFGAAINAEVYLPQGMAVDAAGNLFIADMINSRIRKVGTNGDIVTVAGNGANGYLGDGGAAISAELYYPTDVAVDGTGNLIIADRANNFIREVGINGFITTIAGDRSTTYSGDGSRAKSTGLNGPWGVALDNADNLFIADTLNNCVRKVGINGIITTVAGSGNAGYSGDGGAATNAELYDPDGVVVDATGNLFIADFFNNRVRKVATNGIITTVAGNGIAGYFGDGGAATNAELYYPQGLVLDATGNLFVADAVNNRVRKVIIPGPTLSLTDVGFGNAGAYDLVVSSPYGSVTSSIVNLTVTLFSVQYAATPTAGMVPLTVQFNSPPSDSEGNSITDWNWSFGDGATSTNQNPPHVYSNLGVFQPTLVATNSLGATVIGTGPQINAEYNSGLVRNGGFETGDFTDWSLVGDATINGSIYDGVVNSNYVTGAGVSYVHSGTYGAVLGETGFVATLSQSLATVPGQSYELSFWLINPVSLPTEIFMVNWINNGNGIDNLGAITNPPSAAWTNVKFVVTAVGTNTTLQFGAENDQDYFGLDDISVVAIPTPPVTLSAPILINGNTNFTFQLSGPAGSKYVLQVSTNLIKWTSVSTSAIPLSGTIDLTNAINGFNRRFYKVQLQ